MISVSADPLSPERGSYRFAQQMLQQVAYDTLSRRDRKARHLDVAAHLRGPSPATEKKSPTSSPATTSTRSPPSPTTPTAPRSATRPSLPSSAPPNAPGAPAPPPSPPPATPPPQSSAQLTDTTASERLASFGNKRPRRPSPAPISPQRWSMRSRAHDYYIQNGQIRAAAHAQNIAADALICARPSRRSTGTAHRGSGGAASGSRHGHSACSDGTRGSGGSLRLRGGRPDYR